MKMQRSPDQGLLQDLRYIPSSDQYPLLGETIFDPKEIGVSLNGSLLDPNRRSLEDMVNGKNFFSDLWISKGYTRDEDARYMFSFDLQAYLISNSLFSGLYQNNMIATEIFQGFQVLAGANLGLAKTEILNLTMKKRSLEKKSYISNNNLGTTANIDPVSPQRHFLETNLSTPVPIDISLDEQENCSDAMSFSRYASGMAPGGTLFFHGTDDYTLDRQVQKKGKYQYGVSVVVKDVASLYVLSLSQTLRKEEEKIKSLYGYIINSPIRPPTWNVEGQISDGFGLYDYITHRLPYPLERIVVPNEEGPILTAKDIVNQVITTYTQICNKLKITETDSQQALEDYMGAENLPASNIENLKNLVGDLAYILEQVTSSAFLTNASGDTSHEKESLKSRGYCQRKMPLLEITHFFDEYFKYGENFGQGYAYVEGPGEENAYGIRKVHPDKYIQRVDKEFYKYFTTEGEENPVWLDVAYRDPALQYMTPYIIRAAGSRINKKPQTSFSTRNDTQAKYDIDEYGDLFSALVQYNSDLKYYDKAFSEAEYRDGTATSQNRRLYNDVIDNLENHYGCTIIEKENNYFSVPKIQRGLENINISLPQIPILTAIGQPEVSEESGPDAFRVIIGGLQNNETVTLNWTQGLSLPFVQDLTNERLKGFDSLSNTGFLPYPSQLPPIKLAFGILGELEVDPQIRASQDNVEDTYQFSVFNSLKNQAQMIQPEINSASVRDRVQQTCAFFPNQIKSAFVLALRDTPLYDLGSNGFDAKRFILEDIMPLDESLNVSCSPSYGHNGYLQTEDPMKIYSKFTAFWMNYKQMGCIEYLSGFETVGIYEGSIFVDPPPETSRGIRRRGMTDEDNSQGDYTSEGRTTLNLGHHHEFYVDANGNGWTSEAVHPGDDRVYHRHRIQNNQILSAQSECYPNCEDMGYLVDGVAPHVHNFQFSNQPASPRSRINVNQSPLFPGSNGVRLGGNSEEMLDASAQNMGNNLNQTPDGIYQNITQPPLGAESYTPPSAGWVPNLAEISINRDMQGTDIIFPDPPQFRCFGNKMKRPVWKKITMEKVEQIRQNPESTLLCRIRTFTEELPVVDKVGMEITRYSSAGLNPAMSDLFNIPIYDQYFMITQQKSSNYYSGKQIAPYPTPVREQDMPPSISIQDLENVDVFVPGVVSPQLPFYGGIPNMNPSLSVAPMTPIMPSLPQVSPSMTNYTFNPNISSVVAPGMQISQDLNLTSTPLASTMNPSLAAGSGQNFGGGGY
jgi:hypothetical protein